MYVILFISGDFYGWLNPENPEILVTSPTTAPVMRFWDFQAQRRTREVHVDNNLWFSSVYPLGDSHVTIWVHNGRKIYLLDITKGIVVKSINGKIGETQSSQHRRTWENLGDFKFLASSEDDKSFNLWDLKSGELLHTFKTGWSVKLANMIVSDDKSTMVVTAKADEGKEHGKAMVFDLKSKTKGIEFEREGSIFDYTSDPCTISQDGKMFFHLGSVRHIIFNCVVVVYY